MAHAFKVQHAAVSVLYLYHCKWA